MALLFPASMVYLFGFVLYSSEYTDSSTSVSQTLTRGCAIKPLYREFHKDGVLESTTSGFTYWVKTPKNYSDEFSWPLVVVFSPVINGRFMESFTGLTAPLTQEGFIVAYVNPVSMSLATIARLEEIFEDLESKWCVDNRRIYLSGHSDGGTISQALNFLPEVERNFSGFISSAAGLTEADLSRYSCKYPVDVLILHNTGDNHFKNFGRRAVNWWAECNQCEETVELQDGCLDFQNCNGGVQVKFCEQKGSHLKWPDRHKEITEFLKVSSESKAKY